MKRLVIAFCCLSVLGMCGCSPSPDDLKKEEIQIMNDWADAVEKNEPQSKMDEIQDRGERLSKKYEALNLTTAQKRELAERHKAEYDKAKVRVQKVAMAQSMKQMKEFKEGFEKEFKEGFGKEFGKEFPGFPKRGDDGEGFPASPKKGDAPKVDKSDERRMP